MSTDVGIYPAFLVFDPATNTNFSAHRMYHLQSDIITSLNTLTLGPNGTNFRGSPVQWTIAFNMHSALFFGGACYDTGWELPVAWRSIPVPVGEINYRAYYNELYYLAQTYVEFISAQAEVIDALVLDLITIRRLADPEDDQDNEQLAQDKLKQFFTGNDYHIEDAINMQTRIFYIFEENLQTIQRWIHQLVQMM